METKFNFKSILQIWEDYRSWFIFLEDGSASCRMCISNDFPKEGVISDLFTLEVCRQQGFATELLDFCENFAKTQGCDSISLRSDNDDWVREWYKRIGFEVESSQVWLKKEI